MLSFLKTSDRLIAIIQEIDKFNINVSYSLLVIIYKGTFLDFHLRLYELLHRGQFSQISGVKQVHIYSYW